MTIKNRERVQEPRPERKPLAERHKCNKLASKPIPSQGDASEHGHRTRRGMKFCPRCGSTDIFFASGLPHLWSLWDCSHCGYRGALVIEDGKLASKLAEEYQKENR